MKPELWGMNQRRWLWPAMGFFMVVELVVRMKAGSIFALCFVWLLIHQWLLMQTGLPRPTDNPAERVLVAGYYSTIIAFAVFITFLLLNAAARAVTPEMTFFRLP